ncbi:hypothetical protein JHK84_035091 [Glycine max]|nr:hypothetical protein JHK86_034828 [Glycine max]KAG5141323.1 hypothetical protein JHK84_035091 [Glycine max]
MLITVCGKTTSTLTWFHPHVCCGCALQQSCKFGNQSVWKCKDANNLDSVTVMKVITPYALESVNPQLVVPDEVKKSVN